MQRGLARTPAIGQLGNWRRKGLKRLESHPERYAAAFEPQNLVLGAPRPSSRTIPVTLSSEGQGAERHARRACVGARARGWYGLKHVHAPRSGARRNRGLCSLNDDVSLAAGNLESRVVISPRSLIFISAVIRQCRREVNRYARSDSTGHCDGYKKDQQFSHLPLLQGCKTFAPIRLNGE